MARGAVTGKSGQWLLPFFHLRKDGHSQLSMKLKVDIDEITANPRGVTYPFCSPMFLFSPLKMLMMMG